MAPRLRLLPLSAPGPEDVAVLDGQLVTGVADGTLLRVAPDGSRVDVLADTGGRPLGIEALADGRLLVCDAQRGLLRVDPTLGKVEPLVVTVAGQPMKLCDNAAVAADGTIYFTDSSRRHRLESYQADVVERTATGRLLRRDPDGEVEAMLDGLEFANGVALAEDESFVAVAETGAARILRVWLSGPGAGQAEVLADDLPGLPDNLSTGTGGRIWVAMPLPRIPALRLLQRSPRRVRRLAGRLAGAVRPSPLLPSHLVALDRDGRTVAQIRCGGYPMATGVREHDGSLYLGSLTAHAIAAVSPIPVSRSSAPISVHQPRR